VLTFSKGVGRAPSAARAMAEYLAESTVPDEAMALADYYVRGIERVEAEGTAAIPRADMAPAVAAALGLDMGRTAKVSEVANLLQGLRADGEAIEGRQSYKVGAGQDRVSYIDLTFSAPKSVSVAMALAPTEAERHIIVGAHRDAWMAGMAHLETIIAHARKGAAGSKGSVPGKLGWVSFDHYTARPTIQVPHTEDDGTKTTLIQSVRNPAVPADMQLHTHVTVPNVVFADDGTVGSIDTLAMHDRVHEVGAYYQAHLATNLRAQGIDVVLDDRTEAARMPAVPEAISDLFSKRSHDGEAAAREFVQSLGRDWDSLHPRELVGIMRYGTRSARQGKETAAAPAEGSNVAGWRAQAAAAGYTHRSVIDPEAKARLPATEQDRLRRGYTAALPLLARQFERRATMYASVARTSAARGLIASGVESAADIDRITAAMREHGVQHDGSTVPLMWASMPSEGEGEGRRPKVKITTTLHVAQEREAMALAETAAADRSGALSPGQIDRAVRDVSERDGLDFTGAHGLEQRRVLETLGTSGRLAVAVGVAGSGKSTLLRPLVAAWSAPPEREGDERAIYGTALATRQANQLADAGIDPRNTLPIAGLLARAHSGDLVLNERSVIVVDELGQVGTAQALALLRLRAEHGFSIVAIGDDRQGQAIDAGNSIGLMRKALGAKAVPELEGSVRQARERDRETSAMFRQGDAAGGIGRLQEDGHAVLIQGGHRRAVEAVADLWQARHAANADRAGYTLTASAPTNADARSIGAAIRERRRAAGQVGPDQVTLQATDQNGQHYVLPLAEGDRVRLFATTRANFGGRGGVMGNNGSVVEVERIKDAGVQLRTSAGKSGFVAWDTLRDPASGRVKLTYGDVLSIDAIQGATSTEHINALPSGSQAVTGFKAYVAQSRSRETTWLVIADGMERGEILARRALGADQAITEAEVWANVARNLSRQPEKGLATDLLADAERTYTGTVRSLATAFQPHQQRQAAGGPGPDLRSAFTRQWAERDVAAAADTVGRAAAQAAEATRLLPGPKAREARKAVQAARRSMRAPSQRPKRQRAQQPMTSTQAQAEFADALHRAGLRPKGAPVMDGQRHRVPVEGDKRGRMSGSYVGHLDGLPAGSIQNFKTGETTTWRASRAYQARSPEDQARERARIAADQAAREASRRQGEVAASSKAQAMWAKARPAAASHPYLTRKDVAPHGLRQDRRGSLLVPMRDVEGQLWGVQTITPDGGKLYMAGGKKQGTHALLGELRPGQPLVIAEGFATAATMREVTGLAVAVAFDSGNLVEVARAYRARDPVLPIAIAADNDHHLPRREVPLPNVGEVKAAAAAQEVGGVVLQPAFAPTDVGTDWNDYAAQHGKAAARQLVQVELSKHGFELPATVAKQATTAPAVTQAMRDAARQRAGQAAQTPDQAAREAARRAQQRPVGPRL